MSEWSPSVGAHVEVGRDQRQLRGHGAQHVPLRLQAVRRLQRARQEPVDRPVLDSVGRSRAGGRPTGHRQRHSDHSEPASDPPPRT